MSRFNRSAIWLVSSALVLSGAVAGDTASADPELVNREVPGSASAVIGFSSESDPWPAPPAIDGTAESVLSDNFDETWVVRYDDEGVPVDDPPHWIAIDSGEPRELAGVHYAVKAGQGHIREYNVYVTDDDAVVADPDDEALWGEPVASGELPEEHDVTHFLEFPAPVRGRYVKLESVTSWHPTGSSRPAGSASSNSRRRRPRCPR